VSAVVVGTVAVAFVALNASYEYWHGGGSTGPRHIVPMLPFLAVALAFAWPQRAGRLAASLLLVLSAVVSLACAMVTMYAGEDIANPLFELILPRTIDPTYLPYAIPGVLAWGAFTLLWYRAGAAPRPAQAPAPVAAD
jgi:hypothetical protein